MNKAGFHASHALLLMVSLAACDGSNGGANTGSRSQTATNTKTGSASSSNTVTNTAGRTATASHTASATASSTGSIGTGSATATSWWPSAYDVNGVPSKKGPSNHNVGKDCMNCHITSRPLAFGGTVLSGGVGVAHVQIGIKSADSFYSAYSDSDGNAWLPSSAATIDWTKAEIRSRSSAGEKIMVSDGWAGCNACHTGADVLKP